MSYRSHKSIRNPRGKYGQVGVAEATLVASIPAEGSAYSPEPKVVTLPLLIVAEGSEEAAQPICAVTRFEDKLRKTLRILESSKRGCER
jgi:hypothetical protein